MAAGLSRSRHASGGPRRPVLDDARVSTTLQVTAAGFAPVKGMRHLGLPEVVLDEHGPVGDRAFCLVDVERAQVLRTVQHPRLMAVVARLAGGVLSLDLPDGTSVSGVPEPTGHRVRCEYWGRPAELELVGGEYADAMSSWLGRPVSLAAAPRGAVVFAAPVTIVGTASVRDLAERTGRPEVEAARFRATLAVETDEPYVEETWLGREVEVGSARLRIGVGVPRCAVIDHHPATGVKDARLLQSLAAYRPRNTAGEPVFGVYAEVVAPGRVVGAAV